MSRGLKRTKQGKGKKWRTDGEGRGLRLCSLLSGTVCWLEAELGPSYFIPSSCPVVIFPPFPTFSELEMWHIFPHAGSDKCFFEEEPNYKPELATPKRAQHRSVAKPPWTLPIWLKRTQGARQREEVEIQSGCFQNGRVKTQTWVFPSLWRRPHFSLNQRLSLLPRTLSSSPLKTGPYWKARGE